MLVSVFGSCGAFIRVNNIWLRKGAFPFSCDERAKTGRRIIRGKGKKRKREWGIKGIRKHAARGEGGGGGKKMRGLRCTSYLRIPFFFFFLAALCAYFFSFFFCVCVRSCDAHFHWCNYFLRVVFLWGRISLVISSFCPQTDSCNFCVCNFVHHFFLYYYTMICAYNYSASFYTLFLFCIRWMFFSGSVSIARALVGRSCRS